MDDQEPIPKILSRRAPRPIASTILNGVGNGAMIAGVVCAVPQIISKLRDHHHSTSPAYFRATLVVTGIGAMIGAYYSYQEAKDLNDYRTALKHDLERLHARLDAKEAQPAR